MIRKAMEDITDAGDDMIAEAVMFLDNVWALLVSEVKSPRHLDKYMLGMMLFVAFYVMASCGKPSF